LTRLKRLDQLTTLDHPPNQSGKLTGRRILSIQRLSHHGPHRDQLLKPTFSLRNSRGLLTPLPCIVHRAQTFSVYGLLTTVNSTDFIHHCILSDIENRPLRHSKTTHTDTVPAGQTITHTNPTTGLHTHSPRFQLERYEAMPRGAKSCRGDRLPPGGASDLQVRVGRGCGSRSGVLHVDAVGY